MKYRLKKDLPFLDKGSMVYMKKCLSGEELYSLNSGEFFVTDTTFEALIQQGWIEEVKPREFYLLDSEQMCDRIFYYNMEEVKQDVADWAIKELIKVREVTNE